MLGSMNADNDGGARQLTVHPSLRVTDPAVMMATRSPALLSESGSSSSQADQTLLNGNRIRAPSDTPSPRPKRPNSGVEDLPDLTDRIQSMGLYEEYQSFRQGYLNWRQRGHQGARGEITEDLSSRQQHVIRTNAFEKYYPTFNVWKWRRSMSYWIAVFFLEGSIIFTVASFLACVPEQLQAPVPKMKAMTAWPNIFGGILFTLGAYFMCLECVNLMKSDDQWTYWPFNFKEVFSHLDALDDVSHWPFLASITYLIGTIIFPVGLVAAVFEDLTSAESLFLSTIPSTVGGLLFALAAICECIECSVFKFRWKGFVEWAAFCNFVGGVLFFLGGAVYFLPYEVELVSNLMYGVGSAIFFLGGVFNLLLWKDEQFGLTFLSVLNQFSSSRRRQSNEPSSSRGDAPPKFSMRGIIFVIFYCLVSVMAIFNFALAVHKLVQDPSWSGLTRAFNEALPFLLLHMILVVHSAVVQTPNAQPFHLLVIGSRWLAVFIGANAFMSFYLFVRPAGPDRLPHDGSSPGTFLVS